MSLNFPANPAAQNPVNTYSPTSTPDFTTNGATYIWTGNAWTGSVDGVGLTITSSATPPEDASPNDLWFNTDNGKLYIYYKDVDSEQWVDTSADSTSSLVIVSETPPPNPVQGELWWDSSTTGGILYIYYTDEDSNQWVEVGGNGDGSGGGGATVDSGPNPPANPAINTLWFNTETGKLYIYYQDADSAQWVDTDVGGTTELMPTGGGSDKVFYENDQNIKNDFTLDDNTNAMTAGPITVDDGVSITIPVGQTWTVVGGATGGGSGGGGGDSGYWQRQGTSLSPANAGDSVGTTGTLSGGTGKFTGPVIAGDYDVSFSDKTGVRVGFDGQISVQNPVGSSGTYAYDVLSGNTPTFAVLGTGETRIGGDVTGGSANITLDPAGNGNFAGTGALGFPVGTTAQRPTGSAGDYRFNSSTNYPEYFNGTSWVSQAPDQIETLNAGGWSNGYGSATSDPTQMAQQFVNPNVPCTFGIQPLILSAGTWLVTANIFSTMGPNNPNAPCNILTSLPQTRMAAYGGNAAVVYCSKPDGIMYRAYSNLGCETSIMFTLTVNTSYTLDSVQGEWQVGSVNGASSATHDLKCNCWYTAIRQA